MLKNTNIFSELLEDLTKELDITKSQYDTAIRSYTAVGNYLADDSSPLSPYYPVVRPQGSFMIGTDIKPLNENDELDVDLVCLLKGKNPNWTQLDLKQAVGDRIKGHGQYNKMLKKPDGRRCWTLKYADSYSYHMDILPAIVEHNYKEVLNKAFSSTSYENTDDLEIRITDKFEEGYETENNHHNWLKSNPFGYALWFYDQAYKDASQKLLKYESVKPFPSFQEEKLVLQRVIQILKRHRDIRLNGDEDKPISIIITTIAAKAYQGEMDIWDALNRVVNSMESYIENRYSYEHGRKISWIGNPVNPEENFADKWIETPRKEEMFKKWVNMIRTDLKQLKIGKGIDQLGESMKEPFGAQKVEKAVKNFAERIRKTGDKGKLNMASKTGIIGATGNIPVKGHNFHGQ